MKLVLDNKNLAEDFFEDTRLLGIMAPIKDYQLCWHFNNIMGMDFRINNEIEIQLTKKERNYFFAVYEFSEPTGSLSHYLYNNRFDGEYLLPEFKHLDFLWLMKGDIVTDEGLQQTINYIKEISGVQLVIELTNEKIRNKEHLVF
ncbi:MAG: IPExxxVDY family protein [Bacteroidetes bacterium]|nr:MAG: IPExxxVDY family protein [Bacteroidota bacterium]